MDHTTTTTTDLAALKAEAAALETLSAERDARTAHSEALDAIEREQAENAGALDLLADLDAPSFSPIDHTPPDLITMDALPVRAGARVRRRMGSPAALAAALAALEPDQETLVGARASQWREQLTALEDARQALLDDRQHWLEGVPTVRVMISVIRDSATTCHE